MNKETILSDTIINQIIPNNKNYLKENIFIAIEDSHLIINTKNNEYLLKINQKENIFYWFLYYQKNLILETNINNNFNKIIDFIINKENNYIKK